jgi:hypothetical protein
MKIRNYKETQKLLSVSEYLTIYREWVAQGLERGELSSKVHNLLINLSNVYLNYDYENDKFAIAKNGYQYSIDCDKWSAIEFDKVKLVLEELAEMEVPKFDTDKGGYKTETDFLSFLKMECVLRYRPLLANSWKREQR